MKKPTLIAIQAMLEADRPSDVEKRALAKAMGMQPPSACGQRSHQTPNNWVRPPDAARHLGVSLRTIRDWQRRRLLPFSRMGKRCILFKVSDLDAAIARFRIDSIGGGAV